AHPIVAAGGFPPNDTRLAATARLPDLQIAGAGPDAAIQPIPALAAAAAAGIGHADAQPGRAPVEIIEQDTYLLQPLGLGTNDQLVAVGRSALIGAQQWLNGGQQILSQTVIQRDHLGTGGGGQVQGCQQGDHDKHADSEGERFHAATSAIGHIEFSSWCQSAVGVQRIRWWGIPASSYTSEQTTKPSCS